MLLRITIQNFLSFYNKVCFDMFPYPHREALQHHIYKDKIPLLKQASIYGENGVGKSNFVKAFGFLQSFVCNPNFIQSDTDFSEYRFQLTDEKERLPISLNIEFLQGGQYYIYEVALGREVCERLLISNLGEKEDEVVFSREGEHIESEYIFNPESSKQLLKKRKWASVISLDNEYPIFSPNKPVEDIKQWMKHLNVISINSSVNVLINLLANNSSLTEFANEVYQNVGIANSLRIEDTPLEVWVDKNKNNAIELIKAVGGEKNINEFSGTALSYNQRELFNLIEKKGQKVVQEFIFEQFGVNGCKKGMKIESQSDGTVRLLTLIPAFFFAIKHQSVVVIDEIEHSIHPNLIYNLVKFFANSKTGGQLIFTTHLTKFMNQQELMRPDELWIAEKNNGCTTMKSINDYYTNDSLDIEKGYIEGRYGGVPNINLF